MGLRQEINDKMDSLVHLRDLDSLNIPNGYSLVPVISRDWNKSEYRLLVVIQTVDSFDLRTPKDQPDALQYLLRPYNPERDYGNAMNQLARNLLRLSWLHARRYRKDTDAEVLQNDTFPFAVGFVNFNAAHTFSKSPAEQQQLHAAFTKRCQRVASRLKPTHVLICGDTAAQHLLAEENLAYKRGWVFDTTIGKAECLVTPTLDLEPLYSTKKIEQDDEEEDNDSSDAAPGDLLFYVTRHLTNLYAGQHLHSLRKIKPVPKYIDSVEKFDAMMADLRACEKPIALDSETANLESYKNTIDFLQFAYSSKWGYVLPLYHPKTPFDSDELAYMHKKLRAFFASHKRIKTFITMNGAFDLRVIRAQFKIPFIFHNVWEVTAGEHLLDENIGMLSRVKFGGKKLPSLGGLAAILAQYENDWYYTAPFSKGERGGIRHEEPDNPDVLKYCTQDVQSLIGIRREQLRRADKLDALNPSTHKLEPYRPYYESHVLKVMGPSVMTLSHLMQEGSYVDSGYLIYLMGQNSPLKKLLGDVLQRTKESEAIQDVNKLLIEKTGENRAGLFNKQPFVFDWGKADHKQALFYEKMQLEPVSFTKKTKTPAIDKAFITAYAKEVPEVELFGEFQKITKLLGTYVRGWYTRIKEGLDSSQDNRLRASYGFFNVVTGRYNSFDPNLQNVPSRGDMAKVIKRMFVAPPKYLSIRYDYSAHEIRIWGVIAVDKVIAGIFKVGQALRQQWIKTPIEGVAKELKRRGDVHILNIHRFFGIWVEKSHPLRDSVKQIIFGSVYGKSAKTLGKDLFTNYVKGLDDTRRNARALYLTAKSYKGLSSKELEEQIVSLGEDK